MIARTLSPFFSLLESARSDVIHVVVLLSCIGIARTLLELLIGTNSSTGDWAPFIPHAIAFYVGTFLLFFVLYKILLPNIDERRVRSFILCGMFLGLLPPIIDIFLPVGIHYYVYFTSLEWSFFSPKQSIGESITVWLVIIGTGAYFNYSTKKIAYFFIGVTSAYALAHVISFGIPAIGTQYVRHAASALQHYENLFAVSESTSTLLWVLTATGTYILLRYRFFIATLKRVHHALIWGVLVLCGAQLRIGIDPLLALKAGLFALLFIFVQAQNDFYDKTSDATSNRASSITTEDLRMLYFFVFLICASFIFFDPTFSVIYFASFLLGFLYNHEAFRFKRHYVPATLIEASSAFLVILSGLLHIAGDMIVAPTYSIVALILAFAFGLCANFRDFKDFESDRLAGINTLYVSLARRGIPPLATHLSILSAQYFGMAVVALGYLLYLPVTQSAWLGVLAVALMPIPLLTITKPRLSVSVAVVQSTIFLLFLAFAVFPALKPLLP